MDPGVGEAIRLATLSAVLSGSVFGDHCSPISDTTIMSSMSCASDHIDHVRTQMPYALTCGLAAILIGYIPAGFGISPWITLPIGIAALIALVRFVGRRADELAAVADPAD
jgi:Na+/H+ antiporter NhaC